MDSDTVAKILKSEDGIAWEPRTFSSSSLLKYDTSGESTFAVIGVSGTLLYHYKWSEKMNKILRIF